MAHVPLAPTGTLAEARVAAPAGRLAFLDNLRTLVIAVVILHHAGQAYGPTGGFWPIFNPTRAAILGPFFSVNAAFGMGLMFLLAGYLTPHAHERKGFGRFLGDRLIRLGAPLLVMSLGVFLPIAYGQQGQGLPFGPFVLGYLARPELVAGAGGGLLPHLPDPPHLWWLVCRWPWPMGRCRPWPSSPSSGCWPCRSASCRPWGCASCRGYDG